MATSSIEKKLGHISFESSQTLPDAIIKGGFSKDGTVVWSRTPESLLFYRVTPLFPSTKDLKPFEHIPMDGYELESHGSLVYNEKEFLILTLSDPTGSILLAIYLASGRIIRVMKLPFSVSMTTGISHVTFPGLFTRSPLSSFTGSVACGCGQTGRVFILDLALGHSDHWPHPHIDYPCSVNILNYNEEGLALAINDSISNGVHAMLNLNGKRKVNNSVIYVYIYIYVCVANFYVNGKVYQYYDAKNKLIGSFEGGKR